MLTILAWVLSFFRQFRGYLALIVLALVFAVVYEWMNARVVPRFRTDSPASPVEKAPSPDSLMQVLEEAVREVRGFAFLFGEFPALKPNPCEGRCVFRGHAPDAWVAFRLPSDVRMTLQPVRCPSGEGVRVRVEREGRSVDRVLCGW